MIKNNNTNKQLLTLAIGISIIHFGILFFIRTKADHFRMTMPMTKHEFLKKMRINKIDLIKNEEVEKIRQVGIKGGKKNAHTPDFVQRPPPAQKLNLDFKNLGMTAPPPASEVPTPRAVSNDGIYFKYKKEKIIPPNREHQAIKNETLKNLGVDRLHTKANNISNFDIRIERPEGITEDQLNSDEKAFYAFYKRTYSNYVSKLYATYEKMRVGNPALDKEFENEHILIGKIDYDEMGNIITIKILKSSSSDIVHNFFEESLKQLSIPNPPKIFVKKNKEFSVYYQIHIN